MKKILLGCCILFATTIISQPFPSDGDKATLEQIWNGWNQPFLEGWDFNPAVELDNSWEGITMTNDGENVRSIDLYDKNLSGLIPSVIVQLGNLTGLDLSSNQFYGNIPNEFGNLNNSMSFLDMSHNLLNGGIPMELGSLVNLGTLDLSHNDLTGSIPSQLGDINELVGFDLSFNQLSGSIPPELGNFQGLDYFMLNHNQLTGSIPPELGNLGNLIFLLLNNNQLSGMYSFFL